jgi:hypothetical protein
MNARDTRRARPYGNNPSDSRAIETYAERWTMRFRLALAAGLLAAALGCSSTTSPSGATTLTINLKDSPFSNAKALLVTFSTVSAHPSGGDFMTVPFAGGATSRTCDLKKLATAQDVLGTGPLAAGHYTQIRLVVASAAIYFDNPSTSSTGCASTIAPPAGGSAPVTIPSGEVILNREFDLTSNMTTTMLLDFDGDQSVKDTGNGSYMMSPVIGIVSVQ